MSLNYNKYSKCSTGNHKLFDCDCSVSLVKSNDSKQITFAFYNNVLDRIVGKSDYMIFTTNDDDSRVYFSAANSDVGYKLVGNSNTRKELRRVMPPKENELWNSWKGYYYVRYDKRENYYYIDRGEKIKEG